MDKRGKSKFSAFVIILLFIVFSFYFAVASDVNNNWIIDGNKVYVDDNRVYISAEPHTIQEKSYVYFNLTSKIYEGDIDIVFGFNTALIKPTKAELYKPEWKNKINSYTCTGYFNYTLETKHFWCYKNKTNEQNQTIDGLELIYEHEFENGNLATKTAYWNESYLQEWKDYSNTFTPVDYDYEGMNKWYYVKNIPVQKNKEYYFRGFIEIPREKGFSPVKLDEKYWFAIKPSTETIQEAIAKNHFYSLDPWINSTGVDVNKDYLNNGLEAYYDFGSNAEKVFGILNLTTYSGTPEFLINSSACHLGTNCYNATRYNPTDNGLLNSTSNKIYYPNKPATWNIWLKKPLADNHFIYGRNLAHTTVWYFYAYKSGGMEYMADWNYNQENNYTWAMYTMTVNASGERDYYRNGTWVGSGIVGKEDATEGIQIGHNDGIQILNSLVDDFAIWNRTLNATEITDLWNNGNGIAYSPLLPDTTPPNVAINSPANITYNTNIIAFNISAVDDSGISSCWYSLDNGTYNYTMTNITATIWNATNSSMEQGGFKASFYCNDTENNLNNTESISFAIDTTPPNITIVSPLNQTYFVHSINFNITALDNARISSCWYSLDSGTNATMSNDSASNFYHTNSSLKKGSYNARFYCNDTSNNLNDSEKVTFTILNSPPNQTNPLLKTSTGKNLSTEDLICQNKSTYDADGDNITNIFNWYKNSQPFLALNLPFEINANDYSTNNNPGTINGNPQSVIGKYGNALNFDGIDDYILIPDSDSLDFINTKTWELWFKRNSAEAETLFNKGDDLSNYKLGFSADDKLKFSYSIVPGWLGHLWEVKTKDNFDEGTYNQTYSNTTYNAVMLNNSYNGDYTSKIFNDSGKTLSFNTISFSADVLKFEELSLEESMRGLWHLNENSGNITYDSTPKGNNGTIYGATWTTGKFNSALSFDGIDDGVNILDSDSLSFGNGVNDNAFTISAWIYSLSTNSAKSILIKDGASGYKEYQFYISNGVLTAYLFNLGGTSYIGKYYATALNASQWYYVTMNYNGNKTSSGISLYVNGNKVSDSISQSGTYIAMNNTKSNLTIGMHPTSNWYFNGTIDEVAVWNRSLSSEEILDNYNKGMGVITNLSLSVRSCVDNDCSDKGNSWDIIDLINSPANISSLSNNTYFQFKTYLSTNNTNYSPKLYNITLNYSKQTLETEANITSTTAITDNNWHFVTITFDNEIETNNFKFYLDNINEAEKTENNLPSYKDNNLTIAKFFNGSIDEFKIYQEALTQEQITNNYNLEYDKITASETSGGDNWMCQVTPDDEESDGVILNSSTAEIFWAISFDVTSGEDGSGMDEIDGIACDYSKFSKGIDFVNPYGPYGFPSGYWTCNFTEKSPVAFWDKTITFNANNDTTINVIMSKVGGLSLEEHTWLEAIYNCIILGDCSLYNLLLEMNQTIGNIWEHTKPTDESVIAFENITNKIVDSTHNLTINYTVNIPIKAGYSLGAYLPVRIGFWFLDANNITCYNQGTKPVGVEDPYCQPLVIETIGPMGGSVNFIVKLHPSLPSGSYSIKRIIDIDPNRVWINYGQETIGIITLSESLNNPGIGLEKTGESMPSAPNIPSSNTGGSGGGGSVTNVYNTYVTKTGKSEKEMSNPDSNKDSSDNQINKEATKANAGITGAIIGSVEKLLSGKQISFIITILCGTFVIFIIFRYKTLISIKKK